MQKLGMKRMPIIMLNEYESTWLRTSAQLSEIHSMLCPYPANLMNCYPISPRIADKEFNDLALMKPIGKTICQEVKDLKKNQG